MVTKKDVADIPYIKHAVNESAHLAKEILRKEDSACIDEKIFARDIKRLSL